MTAEAATGVRATECARAKVNLYLHVRGRRPEGFHTLESLAVFPAIGDALSAEPAETLSLNLSGPFASAVEAGEGNLALAAAAALAERTPGRPGAALSLRKSLPVAAGLGGGSADAGAALRLLSRLWAGAPRDDLPDIAFALGADAPVCLGQSPAMMGGAGERLTPAPAFPGFWIVLANPMTPLSTAAVFAALDIRDNPAGPPPPAEFRDFAGLVDWLKSTRNDLEAPARRLRPAIAGVLSALAWDPGCRLARMSGSGATCFGLFADEPAALAASQRLRRSEPGWWVKAAAVERWGGDR